MSEGFLTAEQVIRIQVEIMLGHTWETRTELVPASDAAREAWERIAQQIKEARAKGWVIEIPHELP